MNQLVPSEQTSTREIGFSVGAAGTSIAPQNLGEVVRFAEVMSRADIALPKHLRGNAGACMAVALQALEWQMSPFAVASKSYAVNGMIAYEAQLIAAVVNTRSGIKGRLKYEFLGEGNDLSCKVTGTLDGEECSYESPPFSAITPKNSPLWKTDPRQQLGYYAARSWARRHCPEVLLGVYDREEVEHQGPDNAKDVTPTVLTRLQDRQNASQQPRVEPEGFSRSFVTSETSALSGGPEIEQEPETSASPADAAAAEQPSPEPTVAADHSLSQESGTGAGGTQAREEPDAPSAPATPTDADRDWLLSAARQVWAGTGKGEQDLVVSISADLKKTVPAAVGKLTRDRFNSIVKHCKSVCFGETAAGEALEIIAGIVGVEPKEIVAQ